MKRSRGSLRGAIVFCLFIAGFVGGWYLSDRFRGQPGNDNFVYSMLAWLFPGYY